MSFTNPIVENPYPYAYAVTAASANTLYEAVESLVPGIYTITFSGGGTINVDFYNGNTYIGTATSTSSPFLYNLGTQATNFKFWVTTVSNVVIALTALALTETSGTLYTYTTSQTVTLTGDAYVTLVGGGQGGENASSYSITLPYCQGGRSGNVYSGRLYLNGSTTLTIGAGSGNWTQGSPSTPGETILGTLSSALGSPAAGGTSGYGGSGGGAGGNPGNLISPSFTIFQGSFSSGGGGGYNATGGGGSNQPGGAGAVGTFGTGGTGGATFVGNTYTNGTNGTGYGAGGGAGSNISGSVGGSGTSGICLIII